MATQKEMDEGTAYQDEQVQQWLKRTIIQKVSWIQGKNLVELNFEFAAEGLKLFQAHLVNTSLLMQHSETLKLIGRLRNLLNIGADSQFIGKKDILRGVNAFCSSTEEDLVKMVHQASDNIEWCSEQAKRLIEEHQKVLDTQKQK